MPKGLRGGTKRTPRKRDLPVKSEALEQRTGRGRGRPAKIQAPLPFGGRAGVPHATVQTIQKKPKKMGKKKLYRLPPVKGSRDSPRLVSTPESDAGPSQTMGGKAPDFPALSGTALMQFRESIRGANKELNTKLDELRGSVSASIAVFEEYGAQIGRLENRLADVEHGLRSLGQTMQKSDDALHRSMQCLKSALDVITPAEDRSPPKLTSKIRKGRPASVKGSALQASSPQPNETAKPGARRGRRTAGERLGAFAEEHPNVYSSDAKDPEAHGTARIENSEQRLEEAVKARIGSAQDFNYDERPTTESASLIRGRVEGNLPNKAHNFADTGESTAAHREPPEAMNITFGSKELEKGSAKKNAVAAPTNTVKAELQPEGAENAAVAKIEPPSAALSEVIHTPVEQIKELEFAEMPQSTPKADQPRPMLRPITAQTPHHPSTLFTRPSEKKDFF